MRDGDEGLGSEGRLDEDVEAELNAEGGHVGDGLELEVVEELERDSRVVEELERDSRVVVTDARKTSERAERKTEARKTSERAERKCDWSPERRDNPHYCDWLRPAEAGYPSPLRAQVERSNMQRGEKTSAWVNRSELISRKETTFLESTNAQTRNTETQNNETRGSKIARTFVDSEYPAPMTPTNFQVRNTETRNSKKDRNWEESESLALVTPTKVLSGIPTFSGLPNEDEARSRSPARHVRSEIFQKFDLKENPNTVTATATKASQNNYSYSDVTFKNSEKKAKRAPMNILTSAKKGTVSDVSESGQE